MRCVMCKSDKILEPIPPSDQEELVSYHCDNCGEGYVKFEAIN